MRDPYNLGLSSTSQKLQQLQQQLSSQKQLSAEQKTKLEQLRTNVAALGKQQKDVLNQIDALAGRIAALQTRKRQLETRIEAAVAQLRQTEAQVQVTRGQVTRLQGDVRQLLSALYRQRSRQYLSLLNQATSLSDLVIRGRYANMSGQHNVEVIDSLRAQQADLKAQQSSQVQQTTALQALRAQQLAQLADLVDARGQQQSLVARLEQNKAGQQALSLRTQAQQALTVQSIDTLLGAVVSERSRIEAERRARIEAERARRAEELRKIREAQERARQEAARLAALREAQRLEALRVRARNDQQRADQQRANQQRADQQRTAAVESEQGTLRSRASVLEAQQARSSVDLAPLPEMSGPLGFPLPGGAVVTPYSASVPWTIISGPEGSQAVASAGGNVLAVTNYASLGWVVLIEHSATLITAYLGLDAPNVSPGARVTQSQSLGSIGGSPVFGAGRMAFQVYRIAGNGTRTPIVPSF
ncbi:peptidoglycan DD-metalloendopeptidase family protein [Deinococcus sp.]|uniref:murein hydrolase activator EnvC family protein n=1 Tax=Deinococcus sp. TaxID=47478 RepID=UPI0025FB0FF8|nr:peptidoglycan DD-metalloendopeptidase family protein [Deinococcus sp.]